MIIKFCVAGKFIIVSGVKQSETMLQYKLYLILVILIQKDLNYIELKAEILIL